MKWNSLFGSSLFLFSRFPSCLLSLTALLSLCFTDKKVKSTQVLLRLTLRYWCHWHFLSPTPQRDQPDSIRADTRRCWAPPESGSKCLDIGCLLWNRLWEFGSLLLWRPQVIYLFFLRIIWDWVSLVPSEAFTWINRWWLIINLDKIPPGFPLVL